MHGFVGSIERHLTLSGQGMGWRGVQIGLEFKCNIANDFWKVWDKGECRLDWDSNAIK